MKTVIQTPHAPQIVGPYSQAVRVGNSIFLSGQIPLDPQTMTVVSEDFTAQAVQVFKNLEQVCKAAGGELSDIVKLTVYLTDLSFFAVFNEIMAGVFKPPYPVRTTIQVAALPKEVKIEIDAMMMFV